ELRRFDEFSRQRLLPRRLNSLAPAIATADVNGDGFVDLFVTGSAGQAGALWLADARGNFALAKSQPWSKAAEADDVGATFIDANGDGHPDLLIAAGGVEREVGDRLLNDRLYLNDGHGGFNPAPEGTLPADGQSTGAIAAADFDGDGRTDLFIGGRMVPGKYPATPRSFLYRNTGGKFVDVTDEIAPGLREIGMVTAASFADLNGDGKPDLVIALEWGAITHLQNTGKGFTNVTEKSGLSGRTGWWSALTVADVNADGRLDLIAGNVGLNTKYRASSAEPAVLYAGDFEGNGRPQLIEAHYENGKLLPVRGRSKLAYAFPWITRKFPTFKAYANATVEEIFGADKLAAVRKLTATEFASGIFVQQPDGTFVFQALPRYAQIAPINAIVARDLDADGQLDLYCVGNNFSPEPNTGRFDGSLGVMLKGNGKGDFTPLTPAESGLSVTGDARAAAAIPLGTTKKTALVVARCEGPVLLFQTR
ncbi:MAG TPA: VCBS repeat-containing protein, partial [Opitutus sp.]|nr:VCBS repeat-containing protein [Opitutus sp.]